MNKEKTQNVNVETQMWEKTMATHRLQKITMREEKQQWQSTDATTSCTPSSPHDGYNGGNDFSLSLSLFVALTISIHSYTHAIQLIMFNNIYIYTHMTFRLFTHMAQRGSLGHIYVCIPSNRSG